MAAGIDSQIPGLIEVREKYKRLQLEAFVGIEPKICGQIEVLPFTPRMFLELMIAGNRFVAGDDPIRAEDIGIFLWRISPLYVRGNCVIQEEFISLLTRIFSLYGTEEMSSVIIAYFNRAWDGVPQFKRGRHSISSWVSNLVHMIAKEYGWTEEYILDLPFRRLWQYVNRIMEDANPKYKERCQEADALKSRWLIEQNSKT